MQLRKANIEDVAKQIINEQYDDTKNNGIENHFLVNVINEMVRQQADKIKGYADFIFKHSKENLEIKYETKHMDCTILTNTDELKVMTIFDESIYGPNFQNIIVIDDVKEGFFHIRKLRNTTSAVTEYRKRNFTVPGESFVTEGFIMTYDYMNNPILRDAIEKGTYQTMSDKDKKIFDRLKNIEKMGDNSFHLYECVVYATGMMADVKNSIEEE